MFYLEGEFAGLLDYLHMFQWIFWGFLFASDVDVCLSRCDLGTDEHHRDGGRGRPGVVRTGSRLKGKGVIPTLVHGVTNPRTRHSAPLGFTRIYCTSTDC